MLKKKKQSGQSHSTSPRKCSRSGASAPSQAEFNGSPESRTRRRETRRELRFGFLPAYIAPPKLHYNYGSGRRRRHCTHCTHPVPPPADPPSTVVEKECCGSILIQDRQPGLLIWECDVKSRKSVIQVTILCNSNSTQALNVVINGREKVRMKIQPGNTSNYIGEDVHTVSVSVDESKELPYVEGRYSITTTLQMKQPKPFR
ncbi:S-Ena type endospore appendage [Paenibacillus sp. GCM10027627]|uniref:S-Ena type endospore appendage n=1 Tax=unclassified Paenibacillus TaxID=185978 RepID=UPI00363DA66F